VGCPKSLICYLGGDFKKQKAFPQILAKHGIWLLQVTIGKCL
jgi:hypothetical protein